MSELLALAFALLFSCSFAGAQVSQHAAKPELGIELPSESWILVFDARGFKVNTNGLQPDGRAYLEAENQSTQVTLSVFLERVTGKATDEGCKANQQTRLMQKVDYQREKLDTRADAGMVIVEYTIPEFRGVPVQQRNLFACLPRDDAYVDIHLSKPLFKPEQEQLLAAVLNSAHFVAKNSSDSGAAESAKAASGTGPSLDSFREGSRYFIQQNYPASITAYQKALDSEKRSRTLNTNDWRVLVDNLGMAYGITGDLDHAEETFNYGLSQDSTYPMFYYNLACVAAGRNDLDATMEFLRKAFSYKANMIAGESMPDPRTDDSFKPFMTDRRFREFLNTLAE